MGRMTDPVLLLVYALAIARLTGLVTTDAITEGARDRLIGWLDDRPHTLGSFVSDLITCPWCASVWLAFIASPVVWLWGDHPALVIPALALAFSQLTGMTSNLGR
jgi:Protein of unknown function (DUF1360)